MNTFLTAMQQEPSSMTRNGAVAYGDTGSDLLNYFSNTNDLHRSYAEVESDLNKCWEEDPLLTLRMIVYVRAITRNSNEYDIPVKGLGLRNEGRLGLKWLYNNHYKVFIKNLPLFIEFGSWKDLWHKDLINWVKNKDMEVATLIGCAVFQDHLCRKYLPRYKSKSNLSRNTQSEKTLEYKKLKNEGLKLVVKAINTVWDKADRTFTMRDLMHLKATGDAHTWQQAISKQAYLDIDFNTLPGKVLTWISKETDNGSFLSRHGLEDKYIEWLEGKNNLNTTSYIYELVKPAIELYETWSEKSLSKVQKYTIEKQIQTLLERAEVSNLNVMPVIDTSGSMTYEITKNVTALDVCVSLGIYFSMLQKGSFKDHIIAFDTTSRFKRLSGEYLDRLKDVLQDADYMGSTNFQSVIDLIVKTRIKNPEIPVEEYPDVYLVISDMCFDTCGQQTNHQAAVSKLINAGLPEPLFIWYNVSLYDNGVYQNHKDDTGVIHMSGFDPAAVDRLMSANFQLKFEEETGKSIKDITPYESMIATLEQDYLKFIL